MAVSDMVPPVMSATCLHDEVTNQHCHRNNDPPVRKGGQLFPKIAARRHEAHVYACEEQGQADVGVQHAHQDFHHLPGAHFQKEKLKQDVECKDGEKGCKYFQAILGQFMLERQPQVLGVTDGRDGHGFVCTGGGLVHKSQYHHG